MSDLKNSLKEIGWDDELINHYMIRDNSRCVRSPIQNHVIYCESNKILCNHNKSLSTKIMINCKSKSNNVK